jgi:hypothetical protein
MKRVGLIASFIFALTGSLIPQAASAQECYRPGYVQQPYVYGYGYGYDSRVPYGAYRYQWRDGRRERERHERQEYREREWRRNERREHDRWERNRWHDRDWRH